MQREGLRIRTIKATTGAIKTGMPVYIFAYSLFAGASLTDEAGTTIPVAGAAGEFGPYGIEVVGLSLVASATASFVTIGTYE
jgi:hypothetical protein